MTQQRHALTDEQWQRMAPHLPPVLGRPGRDDRLFIDGVLWIAKTGSPWRDLPAHLGAVDVKVVVANYSMLKRPIWPAGSAPSLFAG